MTCTFDGAVMQNLLPKIRESHPDFYESVKSLKSDRGKLFTYFKYETKNGWNTGRQVRSNGVDLHLLYEKNKVYMSNGRPKRQKA